MNLPVVRNPGETHKHVEAEKNIACRNGDIRVGSAIEMVHVRPPSDLGHPATSETAKGVLNKGGSVVVTRSDHIIIAKLCAHARNSIRA